MSDNVDLAIQQFSAAWRLMCSGASGYRGVEHDGIEYIFSGLPIGFFNVALLTKRQGVSGPALASHGHDACAWAADKDVPWLLMVTHEALESGVDAAAELDACGLVPMMSMTAMIAQHVAPARVPEGLELTVPHDDAGCATLVDVNAVAYGMDLEASKPLVGTRAFWADHAPVLGLADGSPASCAAVMMVDGYRYVALVATDPRQQRRGYAEAAMRRALEVAASRYGEQPSVLHATDAGRPIYHRMGYTPMATHTIFIEKRFLGAH